MRTLTPSTRERLLAPARRADAAAVGGGGLSDVAALGGTGPCGGARPSSAVAATLGGADRPQPADGRDRAGGPMSRCRKPLRPAVQGPQASNCRTQSVGARIGTNTNHTGNAKPYQPRGSRGGGASQGLDRPPLFPGVPDAVSGCGHAAVGTVSRAHRDDVASLVVDLRCGPIERSGAEREGAVRSAECRGGPRRRWPFSVPTPLGGDSDTDPNPFADVIETSVHRRAVGCPASTGVNARSVLVSRPDRPCAKRDTSLRRARSGLWASGPHPLPSASSRPEASTHRADSIRRSPLGRPLRVDDAVQMRGVDDLGPRPLYGRRRLASPGTYLRTLTRSVTTGGRSHERTPKARRTYSAS